MGWMQIAIQRFLVILILLLPTPAGALQRDVSGGHSARVLDFAEWVVFDEVADTAASRGRAACPAGQPDAEKDYVCMGPDPGKLALALIASRDTPEFLTALARQLRYTDASQLTAEAQCHALRKGVAIRPYLARLSAEALEEKCASDIVMFLNRRGKGSFLPRDICASVPEIAHRVSSLMNRIGRGEGCDLSSDVVSMGEQAVLYDRALSNLPNAREICGEAGYPCGMMAELGLSAIETPDGEVSLAGSARIYRFSSDAGLSEAIQCVASRKGAAMLPYLEAVTASGLQDRCAEEVEALHRRHPGKFDSLEPVRICRNALDIARLLNQEIAFLRNPPPATDEVYDICD